MASELKKGLAWAKRAGFPVKPGTFSLSEDGKCLTVLDFDPMREEDSNGVLFGSALAAAVLDLRRICVLGPAGIACAFADAVSDYCFRGLDRQAEVRASRIRRETIEGPLALLNGQFFFTGAKGIRVFCGAPYYPTWVMEDGTVRFGSVNLPRDLVLLIPNLELFPRELLREIEAEGYTRIISSSGSWIPYRASKHS